VKNRSIRDRLTYANVTATLALIVAIAGGSTAIAITASKNSVVTKSIRKGNVTASDLARIQVRSASNGGGGIARVTCRRGERLLGGGASGGGDSIPEKNGWTATGVGLARAYALCLSKKPD
jgi:hypothetical protein